jgi:hypothetical protein
VEVVTFYLSSLFELVYKTGIPVYLFAFNISRAIAFDLKMDLFLLLQYGDIYGVEREIHCGYSSGGATAPSVTSAHTKLQLC